MKEYLVEHKRHGCYYVSLVDESKDIGKYEYLTCFKNKKAVKKFIEQHKLGKVKIDPETRIPTPDFN